MDFLTKQCFSGPRRGSERHTYIPGSSEGTWEMAIAKRLALPGGAAGFGSLLTYRSRAEDSPN